jgi:hypothetical protein
MKNLKEFPYEELFNVYSLMIEIIKEKNSKEKKEIPLNTLII